jgi:hypothetical protein
LKSYFTLGRDEALVLFELLSVFFERDQKTLYAADSPERLALARLLGELEITLVEPFQPNYPQVLGEARERLAAQAAES